MVGWRGEGRAGSCNQLKLICLPGIPSVVIKDRTRASEHTQTHTVLVSFSDSSRGFIVICIHNWKRTLDCSLAMASCQPEVCSTFLLVCLMSKMHDWQSVLCCCCLSALLSVCFYAATCACTQTHTHAVMEKHIRTAYSNPVQGQIGAGTQWQPCHATSTRSLW